MTETFNDPGVQFLYDYWRRKRRGRAMPSRTDIDPTDIPGKFWPNLMLVDVLYEKGRPRFRYRLVGTVFVQAFGKNPTNEFLDQALPARFGYRDYIVGILDEVVAKQRPIYTENSFAHDAQAVPMLTKRISLPLSSDGKTVDVALVYATFEYEKQPTEGYLTLDIGFREIARTVLEAA